MVEALISLAISGMLLAAVATAFTASSSAVEANDQFFRASQTARVTLNQMVTEIRRADALQFSGSSTTSFDVIRPSETLTANEIYRRYSYNASTKQISLQIFYTGGTAGPSYVLANNIESASFGPPEWGQDANNATVPQRVPVTMTVKVGKSWVTLNGSAGPRRAMKY